MWIFTKNNGAINSDRVDSFYRDEKTDTTIALMGGGSLVVSEFNVMDDIIHAIADDKKYMWVR